MKKFFPVVPRPLAGLVDNRYLSEEEESEAPGDEEMGGEDLEKILKVTATFPTSCTPS